MVSEAEHLRITFVLPYAGLSGGIKVLAIYAKSLQRRGHEVVVVSTPWIPPGFRGRAWGVARQWLHRVDPRGWFPGRETAEAGICQHTRRTRNRLDPSHFDGLDVPHVRIRESRPITDDDVPDADVVLATWWQTAPWVAALSARKGAKAYFVQDYGAHAGQPIDAVAETWKLPLHHIVISKWLLTLIAQHSGRSDADYVPNAVDQAQFHSPPRGKQGRPTLGFLFSSAPQKGCDVILEAVTLARKRHPQLRAVAYGPGGSTGDMHLPPWLEFFQYAPDERLKEIYGTCDAWLFASRTEGFGLPILEAMACRTPVIATPAGAAPDLLGEGGGILVKPNDPHDMANAIHQIVELPDKQWRAMSSAAHLIATRYTWDDATDLFETALRRAIATNQTAGVHSAVTEKGRLPHV